VRALVLPDEDRFVVPEVWRAAFHPRRGGLPGPDRPVPEDPAARFRDWLRSERTTEHRAKVLSPDRDLLPDPVLLAEGERCLRAWLDLDDPGDEATPLGSAAAVLLTLTTSRFTDPDAGYAVDAWIARYGVEYAARVLGELAELAVGNGRGFWRPNPAVATESSGGWRSVDLQALFVTAYALRVRLATVTDEEFDRAAEVLGGYRTSPIRRITTSYLAPTRVDWVDADCAEVAGWEDERSLCGMLLLSASSARHLDQLRGHVSSWLFGYDRAANLGTVLDGVGPAASPALADPVYLQLFKLCDENFSRRERMGPEGFRLLAATPTDEAVRLLCRTAIGARRVRLGALLKSGVLTRFPVRAVRVLVELESAPPATSHNKYLERDEALNPDERAVYADLLGRVLLTDPRLLPAVADTLPAAVRDRAHEVVAAGGAGLGVGFAGLLDRHHEARYRNILESADEEKRTVAALAALPSDDAFGLLVDRVERPYVRPALLTAAQRDPGRALRVLLVKAADDDAGTVAELLRNHVLAHPDVVGDGPEFARAAAILAEERGTAGTTPMVLAAPSRGRAARTPEWLVLPALPTVTLKTGDPLSEDAVRQLCALLAASKIAAPHPGVAEVRALCEPGSLAAFGWAVFDQWRAARYPPRSTLGMVALALLGDDSAVPALVELFPSWARGSSGRVRTGMDVLEAIGTEGALRELHRLARKAQTAGFRQQAEQRLARAAAARGLSPDELADRMVPDLGLDADARTVLDYGPRRFTVTFDALFTPHLADEHGARLSRMPKPVATDDAELAAAARSHYTALKKEAQTVALERTRALELAMVDGRRWSAPDFRRFFVEHPLMWQLAHRLLWATFDERGAAVTAFRPAEDRTFADLDDKVLDLAEDATVGIAHPWHFAADREVWTAVFGDYEVIQPFAQLGRELFEPDQARLDGLVGRAVVSRRLWVLANRGWRFEDGNSSLVRDWPDGATVQLGFLGFSYQDPDHEEKLTGVHIRTTGPITTIADLTPIAASEVLRDVTYLLA
jgi:hypothetical protein